VTAPADRHEPSVAIEHMTVANYEPSQFDGQPTTVLGIEKYLETFEVFTNFDIDDVPFLKNDSTQWFELIASFESVETYDDHRTYDGCCGCVIHIASLLNSGDVNSGLSFWRKVCNKYLYYSSFIDDR